MTTGYLESRITERRKRRAEVVRILDDAQRELLVIDAELRAYADALDHAPERVAKPTIASRVPTNGATDKSRNRNSPSNPEFAASRMSPGWKAVFAELARRYPGTLSNDKMGKIAAAAGAPLTPQSQRTTVATYAQRKWLERVQFGVYRITPEGARITGTELPSRTGAATEPAQSGLEARWSQ
jgi:hypothetical protein